MWSITSAACRAGQPRRSARARRKVSVSQQAWSGPSGSDRPARSRVSCDLVVAEALRGASAFLEALPAVDRFVRPGKERNFGRFAAVGAGGRVHLARAGGVAPSTTTARVASATGGVAAAIATRRGVPAAVAAGVVPAGGGTLRLTRLSTCRTPLWLGKTALLVECLLARRERELLTAIAARERLVAHSA